MTADLPVLNPQPHDPGAESAGGLSNWEGRDAPLATLLRNLRHVVEERTALLRDLTRLVQELEEAAKPGHEQGEDQKERKEPRLLEGQIRAREPDMVLASELQGAVVSLPAEKRIGEVDDLIIKADGLGPPVVAPSLGQSALFLARTVRLIFWPRLDGPDRRELHGPAHDNRNSVAHLPGLLAHHRRVRAMDPCRRREGAHQQQGRHAVRQHGRLRRAVAECRVVHEVEKTRRWPRDLSLSRPRLLSPLATEASDFRAWRTRGSVGTASPEAWAPRPGGRDHGARCRLEGQHDIRQREKPDRH
jgi:hypothetical protein